MPHALDDEKLEPFSCLDGPFAIGHQRSLHKGIQCAALDYLPNLEAIPNFCEADFIVKLTLYCCLHLPSIFSATIVL